MTADSVLAQNPCVMKSASSHPRTSSADLLGVAGPSLAGVTGVSKKQSKRQGIAQMRHMCMCRKMSMPVAGVLEVPL